MPIKFDYTPYKATMQLAALSGQADRAKREEQISLKREEMAARKQESQADRAFRREMTEFDAQLRIESSKRSKMWEVEKMEMRSRLDFQEEEQTRMRKKQETDVKLEKLDEEFEKGMLTGEEYKRIKAKIEYGVTLPSQRIDPMKQMIANMMQQGGEEVAPEPEKKGFGEGIRDWAYNLGSEEVSNKPQEAEQLPEELIEKPSGSSKAPMFVDGVLNLPLKGLTEEEVKKLPKGRRFYAPNSWRILIR